MKKVLFILSLIGIILTSCKKEESPTNALSSFINYRFEEGQTRDRLIDRSYGKMKRLLSEMSDDDFKKFASVNKLEKKKFKIILENCREEVCYITYVLKYSDYETKQKKTEKFNVEVKKIAKIEKVDNTWLVSDINNIKTYINSKQQMDIDGKKDVL